MKTVKSLHKAAAVLLLFAALLFPAAEFSVQAADVTSAAGQITTGALNVRSAPGTTGKILTSLPYGSYVTLISPSGTWWRVEYAPGAYGYMSGAYIKYVGGTFAATATSGSGSVSVRSSSASSYPVSGTVTSGRTVLVLHDNGSWSWILYNGSKTGCVPDTALRSVMAWPVPASHKINQYFSAAHEGLDIGASVHGVSGDAVVAAQYGKVVYSGWLNGYGYVVYVNSIYNGQPIQTRYAHLASMPLVTAGSVVGAGQKIGVMGNSGTSSGVHLHFEVCLRKSNSDCIANADSTPVNPLDYIS
ncbi:peptidoglycan DD-metalloendopeptidase family protein [Oscillospiraceae bacterium WX1]